MAGPIEQFLIKPIVPLKVGSLDISFTNSSAMMVAATALAAGIVVFGMRNKSLVPGRLQSLAEMLHDFVASNLKDVVGPEGRPFFPFVFSLFMFVLLGNLLGMLPYGFTFTSHLIVTMTLAMAVFLLVTVVGFVRHGTHFFGLFAPQGAPLPVMFILVPIEVISYFIRPLTHGMRLFGNMMAGHIMLKVFAGFSVMMGVVFGIVPMVFNVAMIGLEFFIACLQAYVFMVLTCIYLNDAVNLH
ncbi:MAG: F0F1 ATP synthase subunit A [Alphaproteobacteria bacterium]|nr:F0F1 ATP synthase subunit A [Alphaproteobacteria bacterium]